MNIDEVWKKLLILDAIESDLEVRNGVRDKVIVLFGSEKKYLKLLKRAIKEVENDEAKTKESV